MQMIQMVNKGRLEADIRVGDIIVHLLVWFVLTIVTLGVALFWWPYSFAREILGRVYVTDEMGHRIGRLDCPSDPGSDFVHGILWFVLTLVTLGLAAPFYAYNVAGTVISRTKVLPVS